MDTRNGQLYANEEQALKAGVPRESLEEVATTIIKSGPFKGRMYVVLSDGRLGRRVMPPKEETSK